MRFRPRPVLTLVTAATVAALVWLGTWQLERKAWKEGLIAAIAARYDAPSVPLATVPETPAEAADHAFAHVTTEGRFLDRASFLLPRPAPPGAAAGSQSQPGFGLLTFLERRDGPPVLVDRGWIPAAMRGSPPEAGGTVRLTGVLRLPPAPSWLTPENDPADGTWYRVDPPAMAAAAGVGPTPPFYVALEAAPDAAAAPPVPPERAVPGLRNEHLGYAVTWYGLAAALLAIYVLLHRRPG